MFKSEELNNYFSQMPWYSPVNNNDMIKLSDIEKRNVFLSEFFKKIRVWNIIPNDNNLLSRSKKWVYHSGTLPVSAKEWNIIW